jgi:hypothetical protein
LLFPSIDLVDGDTNFMKLMVRRASAQQHQPLNKRMIPLLEDWIHIYIL